MEELNKNLIIGLIYIFGKKVNNLHPFQSRASKNIDPKDFCGQECLISEIHRIINLPSESK